MKLLFKTESGRLICEVTQMEFGNMTGFLYNYEVGKEYDLSQIIQKRQILTSIDVLKNRLEAFAGQLKDDDQSEGEGK